MDAASGLYMHVIGPDVSAWLDRSDVAVLAALGSAAELVLTDDTT